METHFAVCRLAQSYVKAELQSTIYNNTHLEKRLTLCQVDLGLKKKKKENGRGYIFSLIFLQVSFPPFHPHCGIFPVPLLRFAPWCWIGAFISNFSLCPPSLVCAVYNIGPTFFLCRGNKNCKWNNGSFSSKNLF